jgi:integrase
MKRLLAATADRERCNLSSLACRTLLLLLYGTGLRIGEAVGLNLADVDLDSGILCIREAKFYSGYSGAS